jgi:hypothetical protein
MVNMTKKGITISCVYNNKPRTGMIEQMKIVNGKTLVTVNTQEGYRAMYVEKMQDYKIVK